ncbi:MAG: hypothetical protein IKV40_02470 [Clostridia bacterium]|nr:hypothetical protein [Clostridia bacterium]
MKITPTSVTASSYSLKLTNTDIHVFLHGEEVATLHNLTALNTTHDDNETFTYDVEDNTGVTVEQVDDNTFCWSTTSTVWEKKIYTLKCFENRFEYYITVKGKGRVDTVEYFASYRSPEDKWRSINEFCEGFYPDIDLGSEDGTYRPERTRDIYWCLSVPPMFYHSYKCAGISTHLAFGVVAEMGEHNFTNLAYNASEGRFCFTTDQYGHAVVDGKWTTPKMVVYTADDHYDAGDKYCSFYFDGGICPKGGTPSRPRFWYGPISCGWIEQDAWASREPGRNIVHGSNETVYREMRDKLEKLDLHPQIMIIDDKWQTSYGDPYAHPDRWPDLRGFIDENYSCGIHTFLWYKLWADDGLPEECKIADELGNSYVEMPRTVVDPSHPTYKEILKKTIHRLLSSDEGCYNAAGFKFDFGFLQPRGRKVKTYSGKYGAELFFDYFKMLHTYVKEVKPDAVVNASPMHPIFGQFVDHARLHDYDSRSRNAKEVFEHRARLWGMANPTALIDTDGGGFNTHRDMMRMLKNQPNIGIPDIYCVSKLGNFCLTEDEWKTVADLWREYGEKCDNLCK